MSRLEMLKNRLHQYLVCEEAILSGAQEYAIGTRRLTRANLSEIAEMIQYLEREIAIEKAKASDASRNKVIGVIPRDL